MPELDELEASLDALTEAVLSQKGGEGFFRAAGEFILKAQDRWTGIVARYQIKKCKR